MIGSFVSGLSGLKANQTMLEVIGNNVANANTVGFKSSRTTFTEVLARTIRDATIKTAPLQVGRGTQVSSITTAALQGSLQETGRETDLAIQGRGFFVLSDGDKDLYTRAGSFLVNDKGELVDANGLKLQGRNAVGGTIPPTATKADVVIPNGGAIPPRATTQIGLSGNLDAGMKVIAMDATGQKILIGGREGLIGTTMTGSVSLADNGTVQTVTGVATDFTALNAGDQVVIDGRVYTVSSVANANTMTVIRPTLTGTIEIAQNANRVIGTGTKFTSELRVGDTIDLAGQQVQITAINNDSELIVSAPAQQAIAAGGSLSFGTGAGVAPLSGARIERVQLPPRETKLQNLGINDFPIASDELANILVKDIATGRQTVVTVTGAQTLAELEQSIQQSGFASYQLNSPNFQLAKLDDRNAVSTSFRAIDSQGTTHTALFTFFKTETANTWIWKVTVPDMEGKAQPPTADFPNNGMGTLTFNPDGTVQAFRNFLGAEQFTLAFNPNSSADPVSIELNLESVRPVTQFNLESDATVTRNNGRFSGTLQSFTVDASGILLGAFSNGEVRTLAQLYLADFANPSGLSRQGESLFATTDNSGQPILTNPSEGGSGAIVSGALELSNVSIAEEFTNMILAQRGFQSSANVITTTDSLMNEVLNLKRA